MYVPFFTTRPTTRKNRRRLERRKGGGGKGGGGSSSGGSSGGGKTSSSGGGGSTTGGTTRTSSITSTSGTKQSSSSYGNGGGPAVTIPSGSLFAGRSQGGGTRSQVYGTSAYGSGYPGVSGRGVDNRGFPFYYWPLAFGGAGVGGAAYMHTNQYGHPNNSSRPGGVMTYGVLPASSGNTTFFIISDNSTVASLLTDIKTNCSSSALDTSKMSSAPIAYNETDSTLPQPESTIQYYRASSVSLALKGYNNTADFEADGTPDTPIPSYVDKTLLDCLNYTVGEATPLVDASGALSSTALWNSQNAGLVALVLVFFQLCSF